MNPIPRWTQRAGQAGMKMAFLCVVVVALVGVLGIGGMAALGGADGASVGDSVNARQVAFWVEIKPLVAGPSDAGQWDAWREGRKP